MTVGIGDIGFVAGDRGSESSSSCVSSVLMADTSLVLGGPVIQVFAYPMNLKKEVSDIMLALGLVSGICGSSIRLSALILPGRLARFLLVWFSVSSVSSCSQRKRILFTCLLGSRSSSLSSSSLLWESLLGL